MSTESGQNADAVTSAFHTTHWTVVLAAARTDGPQAHEALGKLCRTYWYPLYAYVRRRGYSEHDAEDLTQGFFAHVIERDSIQRVARDKGRFRSFLLAAFNYFIADERDRSEARKRGGKCEILSLNVRDAESRYVNEPAHEQSPEKIFEHRWAMTVLDQVLSQLAQEFTDAGKRELFERLQPFLVKGTVASTYADAAREFGLSEDALKKAVQRMRRRYHQLFREEIAKTVSGPEEVEDELRHLCAVLGAQ